MLVICFILTILEYTQIELLSSQGEKDPLCSREVNNGKSFHRIKSIRLISVGATLFYVVGNERRSERLITQAAARIKGMKDPAGLDLHSRSVP